MARASRYGERQKAENYSKKISWRIPEPNFEFRQPNSTQKISWWSLLYNDFCFKSISESGVVPFPVFVMAVVCPKNKNAFDIFQRNQENSSGNQFRITFSTKFHINMSLDFINDDPG